MKRKKTNGNDNNYSVTDISQVKPDKVVIFLPTLP